jgi:SAM-dependent methyltransferase
VTAAQQWADELAAWTIDPAILAAAPESPYTFPPELFRADGAVPSPLLDRAREVMDDRSSVLDVGCGAGAASLPLAPPARHIVAVDTQSTMLDALGTVARQRDLRVTRVDGRWPDVADRVPSCDVAVCSHVFYNVAYLGPFALALSAHASRRVVAELHAEHPWVDLGPLWQRVHHQPRPAGPTADLAVEVLRAYGIEPSRHEWVRPAPVLEGPALAAYVGFTRRRLCLPVEREPEIAAYVAEHPPRGRPSVVLWWDL